MTRLGLLAALLWCLIAFCGTSGRRPRGPKWWNLANIGDPRELTSNDIQSNSLSDHTLSENVLRLLRKKQRRLVRENEGALLAVASGIRKAIHECQYQFRHRHWNCTVTPNKNNRGGIFGRVVSIASRESSFLYAITSAGVLHSLTRACTEGSISTCRCIKPRSPSGPEWEWGGCSEDIDFGYKFSKSFVAAGEKGGDERHQMNVHNNEAGRLHVKTEMKLECKCHGMSGSCTVRTCWRRLPYFRRVGQTLKERFDGASRMRISNSAQFRKSFNRRRKVRRIKSVRWSRINVLSFNPEFKPPSLKDLVYFEKSPDYCYRNRGLGIPGTIGRQCNSTSLGVDGCDLLCCGRGFRTQVKEVLERCSCTFKWCCDVKCKVCRLRKPTSTCL